ncbi:MAG TPA: anthranilate synthase component I [Alphaproteobacteria bacterium]|nr:anthranilate synthase component I [Alphaproteobacteria bacterium]
MTVAPSFDAFAAAYRAKRAQVVWTTLIADLDTPVSAMLKLADGRAHSFLFESVERGVRNRYSFVGLKPDLIWRCRGGRAEINRRARVDSEAFEPCPARPLESLRALVAECRFELPPGLPPMASGLFGYMSYDMVREMERIPDKNPDALGVPEALFLRPTVVAVFDSLEDTVTLFTPVWPEEGVAAERAYDLARERLADLVADFERSVSYRRETGSNAGGQLPEPRANMTREAYHRLVERAKEYIRAGDIFQVVPSQRFAVPFRLPPFALYRALRRLNPSPFLFFLDLGGFAIVGSSPEILVRLRDGTVTIRPIAGTRPRGKDAEEDKALAESLLADPKELAEHLMLLDLARNDVGRVAKIGTVKVTEKMAIEPYSHVMHIVSNVEGTLDPKHDAIDALIAGFPAGTVSGAPKIRAMEIIDELESERRGVYGGAVGYFAANGAMDTCIALRTAVVKDGTMFVQAGGGVVADSDPEAEYQETRNKARALIRAAEEAVRFASRSG